MSIFGNKKDPKKKEFDPNKNEFTEDAYKDKIKAEEGETLSGKEAIKTDSELPYNVQLCDVWGSTTKYAVKFGAKRFIDKGNVFLVNEKRNFKEPFPEDTTEWREDRMEVIETELKLKKKILDNLKDPKNADFSEKDLRQDVKHLLSFKRSLELQGKGSYMVIDADTSGGRPLFIFDRKGNYRIPVFKNIDLSLMYLPTEAKITEASDLIRENDEKNSKSAINIAAGVFLVLIVLAFFGMIYMLYKTGGLNSEVVDALKDIAVNQDAIAQQFGEYLTEIEELANPTLNESVTPNVNVVNN